MKKYAVDEVIFGDNTGIRNFVYFVLSGCCQMIETMKVLETTRLGRTSYTLYDPYVNTFFCQLSIVFFFYVLFFVVPWRSNRGNTVPFILSNYIIQELIEIRNHIKIQAHRWLCDCTVASFVLIGVWVNKFDYNIFDFNFIQN